MNYTSIDPLLSSWAAKHCLHIYTTYRDEEVRSVELINSAGQKCQLWVEVPDANGNIQVHIWDYKKRKQDYKLAVNDLAHCLEAAHEIAKGWLGTDK